MTDYVVTVYPTADAYFQPPAQTICTGQTTNVDILSHVAGTSFTWTASASSPLVSGFLAGNGTNISHTIFSSSTLIETVTYVITPVANGCTGTPSSLMITVNPGPAITTSPLAQTICSAQSFNVGLTSNVAGTAFNGLQHPLHQTSPVRLTEQGIRSARPLPIPAIPSNPSLMPLPLQPMAVPGRLSIISSLSTLSRIFPTVRKTSSNAIISRPTSRLLQISQEPVHMDLYTQFG